jgi:AcrR family transcriptional regulator
MSLTAVTHHFPDKTALLQAVLDAADHEIQPAWGFARAGHLSTAEAVLQVVRRNLSRPEMLRMLALVAAEGSSGDQPIHGWLVRRYDRLRAFIRESIARDQESGHVATQQDPGFLADAVIALWDGLQLQWLIDPRVDMAGRMRTALEALMPGAVDGSGAEGGEPLAPPSPSLAG